MLLQLLLHSLQIVRTEANLLSHVGLMRFFLFHLDKSERHLWCQFLILALSYAVKFIQVDLNAVVPVGLLFRSITGKQLVTRGALLVD